MWVVSLRVQLVTLPDQCLAGPCLAECVLAIATGLAVDGQAEVPLERIHAFYWEMGQFTGMCEHSSFY